MLLDLNNEPTNTVYYHAAAAYGCLLREENVDFSELMENLSEEFDDKKINSDFFSLGLDFYFIR